MSVLVVGSSGFLGRTVAALLRQEGRSVRGTYLHNTAPDALPFDFWQDDVTPPLEQTETDTVIFTAAVETDAPTSRLAERAERFFGACAALRVVYLSSDALFDGLKGRYTEADPPSPTTLYGKNLDGVEGVVRRRCPDACIVRPSYLYGFSLGELDGRLSSARRRLLSSETVRYAEDMFKSPMEVSRAADAVAKPARSGYVGTVHLSGERTSVYGFYRDAMSALGVQTETLLADRLDPDAGVPRDTSLEASLIARLTGVSVLGVRAAFRPGE